MKPLPVSKLVEILCYCGLLLVASSLTACGAAKANHRSTQSVIAPGIKNVLVMNYRGDIEIHTWAEEKVRVETSSTGFGDTRNQAQATLDNVLVDISQDSQTVKVQSRLIDQELSDKTETNLVVYVPDGVDFEAGTGSGDVRITLPEEANFTIQLSTGKGKVTTEFPIFGEQGVTALSGVVGAQPEFQVRANTGLGDVLVYKR
jgi:hypothetical protein